MKKEEKEKKEKNNKQQDQQDAKPSAEHFKYEVAQELGISQRASKRKKDINQQ